MIFTVRTAWATICFLIAWSRSMRVRENVCGTGSWYITIFGITISRRPPNC